MTCGKGCKFTRGCEGNNIIVLIYEKKKVVLYFLTVNGEKEVYKPETQVKKEEYDEGSKKSKRRGSVHSDEDEGPISKMPKIATITTDSEQKSSDNDEITVQVTVEGRDSTPQHDSSFTSFQNEVESDSNYSEGRSDSDIFAD